MNQPRHWKSAAPSAAKRSPQHGKTLAAHRQQRTQAAHAVVNPSLPGARGDETDREEDEADDAEDDEAGHCPVWDLGRQQDPGDKDCDREEVEEPMGEHGAEEGGARPLPARDMSP